MRRVLAFLLAGSMGTGGIGGSAALGAAALSGQTVVLKAGTEVKLAFAQSLSSKHVVEGETVELRVAEEVKIGDVVVVPKGARVLGTVTKGKKSEKRGNSKDLAVRVDYVLAAGRKIALTGEQTEKAKTNAGAATASTLGFGLAGLAIYLGNREAWIKEGTVVSAYVAEDVELPGIAPSAAI